MSRAVGDRQPGLQRLLHSSRDAVPWGSACAPPAPGAQAGVHGPWHGVGFWGQPPYHPDPSGRKIPDNQPKSHVSQIYGFPHPASAPRVNYSFCSRSAAPGFPLTLPPAPAQRLHLLCSGLQGLHAPHSRCPPQLLGKKGGVLLCSFLGVTRFMEFNSHPHSRFVNFSPSLQVLAASFIETFCVPGPRLRAPPVLT